MSGSSNYPTASCSSPDPPDHKIIAVEDPVEYQLSGINQVQVRSSIGLSFSAALSSIIEPLLIVVLAVVVGTIVIALFMPMVSIIGNLS